jgi:hypothetical protein
MSLSIKFTTSNYPEGIEYDVIPSSGSTTDITFFPLMKVDYVNSTGFDKLNNGIKNLWHKYNLDAIYTLVPKKIENGNTI